MKSVDEYVDLMSKLNLPNPKMMDVAVPANMRVGLAQDEIARKGWAVTAGAGDGPGRPADRGPGGPARTQRARQARHDPGLAARTLSRLAGKHPQGGMLHELASSTGKRIVFYCAFGERSAMAVQAAQDAGLTSACHIHGGIDAWRKAHGPLVH